MFDFESGAEDFDRAIASILQVNWSALAGGLLAFAFCLWLVRSGGIVSRLLGMGGLTLLAWWTWQSIFPDGGVDGMLGD
jgi:hypothetical protein